MKMELRSRVCCSFLLGSVMCMPKVVLTTRSSLCVFASRGVRKWGLTGGHVSTPDGEDLAWVGIAKGSRWCSLLIWHKARVIFLSTVLDEPGRACDSSLLHQNLVNHSELGSYPRYGAAFDICEAEHLFGEEDLSAPARRMSACLRQWELSVLVPLNWICWEKPSPLSYWFYAQQSLAASLSYPFWTEIASHQREGFSEVMKCSLCKGKLLKS